MQNDNVKSSVVAGLLGIFLGSFGAHDWYLGDKKKGAIHVCLFAAGMLVAIISGILQSSMSWYTVYRMGWLFAILSFVTFAVMGANEVWGFVEGIMLLVKGDADLAAKGYKVAAPAQGAPTQNAPVQNVASQNTQSAAPVNNPAPVVSANSNANPVATPATETPAAPAAESAPVVPAAEPAQSAPATDAQKTE